MNGSQLTELVNAVLYEGYILYPYRPSSKKNSHERFTFGRVYPQAYSVAEQGREPCLVQTECLVRHSGDKAAVEATARFLHPMAREIRVVKPGAEPRHPHRENDSAFQVVPELEVDGELYQTWMEAVEREVTLPEIELNNSAPQTLALPFAFQASRSIEPLHARNQEAAGWMVRRQCLATGLVECAVRALEPGLHKITIRICNSTPLLPGELAQREEVALRTLASVHTLLTVQGGEFVSLLDPPAQLKDAAAACANIGTWPVLVGDEKQGERDTMLSSPIILYDYPKVAPESAGPLFDATEIDEILSLRILTLTEREKIEMRRVDEQARRLLERTESLSDERWLKLHGTLRPVQPPAEVAASAQPNPGPPVEFDDFFGASTRLEGVSVKGVFLRAGDRVRLCPKARADAIDLALKGQTAVIEAVEQDLERQVHLAVVLEHDPGKDLGLLRQPGHRFFYGVDEVEPLLETSAHNETASAS